MQHAYGVVGHVAGRCAPLGSGQGLGHDSGAERARLPIRLPSGVCYWTVLDGDLAVVADADATPTRFHPSRQPATGPPRATPTRHPPAGDDEPVEKMDLLHITSAHWAE